MRSKHAQGYTKITKIKKSTETMNFSVLREFLRFG